MDKNDLILKPQAVTTNDEMPPDQSANCVLSFSKVGFSQSNFNSYYVKKAYYFTQFCQLVDLFS